MQVFQATTLGGRYRITVARAKDAEETVHAGASLYDATLHTGDAVTGRLVGYTKAQMGKRLRSLMLNARRIDRIRYLVTEDTDNLRGL